MDRRVVISGIGLVTPLGVGTTETWSALLDGKSGITGLSRFDVSAYPSRIGGEVKDFEPTRWMSSREVKSTLADRFIQYALAAGAMAWEDAGISLTEDEGEQMGCYVGSGMGGLASIEASCQGLSEKGPRHGISPFFVPQLIINLAAGQLSIRYGAKGPICSQVSACSSGAHAIGDSLRVIQRGEADIMLCGGTEAVLTPTGLGGFCAMRALSSRNDSPTEASRPFDSTRDGFVMAEGAGILVLEEYEHARTRGAKIYAEVAGYGATADAHHVTAPSPEGNGAQRCMRKALSDAHLSPSDIDYINAHGTSTKMNDVTETFAIKKVFGDHAKSVMVSSTKSMTGHMLGAAGGVETAICALAIHHGEVPPTINLDHPDPDCDLDYVPKTGRSAPIRAAMTNSFGFGGTNACLVLKQVH